MASSPVQICNAALLKLGAERINSLTENNKRARLCNERYDGLRREVLRAHPWNFAIKRANLPRLSTPPAHEYRYQYQIPADSLRILGVEEDRLNPVGDILGNSLTKYKIEGRLLVTNIGDSTKPAYCSIDGYNDQSSCEANGGTWVIPSPETLAVRYIKDEVDTTRFDPNFDNALACRMAAEFAYSLVQSTTVSNNMYQLYELTISRARTQDGQEGSPDDLQADFFVSSRF